MYSTHNIRKSISAERFIRNLKKKIYKYMTSPSQMVYINKKVDKVNKCNNACHITIKMKSGNITLSTYCDFGFKSNEFKVSQQVTISK